MTASLAELIARKCPVVLGVETRKMRMTDG